MTKEDLYQKLFPIVENLNPEDIIEFLQYKEINEDDIDMITNGTVRSISNDIINLFDENTVLELIHIANNPINWNDINAGVVHYIPHKPCIDV